jgi:hypothetical protein
MEERGYGAEVQSDAMAAHMLFNGSDHFTVERGEDLLDHFDQVPLDAAMPQILGHLDTDVAGADGFSADGSPE